MQSASEYMNIIYNGVIIKCKEVEIPDKSYCKLVTSDGRVAVLLSPVYGSGWSSGAYQDQDIKHQLIFDSKLVLFVFSQKFKDNYYNCYNINAETKDRYEDFITYIIPHIDEYYIPSIDNFKNVVVEFIPENTMFRIKAYDGYESVEIFKPDSYYTS
jgi:hypothetical protein